MTLGLREHSAPLPAHHVGVHMQAELRVSVSVSVRVSDQGLGFGVRVYALGFRV